MKAKKKLLRRTKQKVCQHDALITASLVGNLVLLAVVVGFIFAYYGISF